MPDKFITWRNEYNAEKYDRFSLMLPKGMKEDIKKYAEQRGESVNGFINRAIREAMERDIDKQIDEKNIDLLDVKDDNFLQE